VLQSRSGAPFPFFHCIALLPFEFGRLVVRYESADLARTAVSLMAIVPSGLLMGFGFPTGIEIANAIDTRPTPWFWAVNGSAGVLAAGLAVTVSIAVSISAALWVGAACYLALCPVAISLLRLRGRYGATRAATPALALNAWPPRLTTPDN
jgi:hypothetical protein